LLRKIGRNRWNRGKKGIQDAEKGIQEHPNKKPKPKEKKFGEKKGKKFDW